MASFTDSSTIDVNDDEDGDVEDSNVDDELEDDTNETDGLVARLSLVPLVVLLLPE